MSSVMSWNEFGVAWYNGDLKEKEFVLLKEAVRAQAYLSSDHWVFAVAQVTHYEDGQPVADVVYGLAAWPTIRGWEISVLVSYDEPYHQKTIEWKHDRRRFYYKWIQEWLKTHHNDILRGGMLAQKALTESLKK